MNARTMMKYQNSLVLLSKGLMKNKNKRRKSKKGEF